jgi:ADP-heptose:LPS heptosyltransferase
MPRTIVILHPGGLGDLLLAVPAIGSLRERFPAHRLLLCGHDQAAELLVDCGLADRWISAQATGCTALFAGMPPDDVLLTDWLKRCDLSVAWTSDDEGRLAAALTGCGAASVIVQSPFTSTLKSVHQSERFVEILGGEPGSASTPLLSLPHATRAEGAAHLAVRGVPRERPLALVHPGSGSRHKCVKPAVLVPVLEGLEALGLEPLLLEGPADQEIVERLLRSCSRRPVVLRDLSVRVLAGVLSHVDLFVGHDSGVTHLAALLGTPTVALFGPTDPARWAPRGPAVGVIRETSCSCASWEAVRSCVEKPCLEVSPQTILAECLATRAIAVTPRIS